MNQRPLPITFKPPLLNNEGVEERFKNLK
jgi:hypothetical protein